MKRILDLKCNRCNRRSTGIRERLCIKCNGYGIMLEVGVNGYTPTSPPGLLKYLGGVAIRGG